MYSILITHLNFTQTLVNKVKHFLNPPTHLSYFFILHSTKVLRVSGYPPSLSLQPLANVVCFVRRSWRTKRVMSSLTSHFSLFIIFLLLFASSFSRSLALSFRSSSFFTFAFSSPYSTTQLIQSG